MGTKGMKLPPRTTDVGKRFLARLAQIEERGDPAACWPWPGKKTAKGYGQLRQQYAFVYAHRVSYEVHVGPISEGLVIDHLCRNHACVNPAHLEPVTPRENTLRGDAKLAPSPLRGRRRETCRRRGHPVTPENTVTWGGTLRCKVCYDEWCAAHPKKRTA